jgi:hypothetical protein
MNYQIADAKTRYFKDKEHYLNFLNAWKQEASSDNCRLTAAHMFLYALARGKDVRTAFTPITRETKLRNGAYANHGLYWAYDTLSRFDKVDGWYAKTYASDFLAPFNETIDMDTLVKISQELPRIEPLYSDYGKGKAIAQMLIETDERNAHVLWKMIEEIKL